MVVPQRNTVMGRVKQRQSDNSGSEARYSANADPKHQNSEASSQETGNPLAQSQKNRLNLRLAERKGDQVAPKPQMTSPEGHHDNDAFAVRLNVFDSNMPDTDQLQVISVSSFGDIRIMTLNQPFVEEFYERQALMGLGDMDSEAKNGEETGTETNTHDASGRNKRKSKQ